MEDVIISKYIKIFELLSLDAKLELLAKLAGSMRNKSSSDEVTKKQKLAKELYGAWSDVDDDLAEMIYATRTIC